MLPLVYLAENFGVGVVCFAESGGDCFSFPQYRADEESSDDSLLSLFVSSTFSTADNANTAASAVLCYKEETRPMVLGHTLFVCKRQNTNKTQNKKEKTSFK